MRCLSRSPPAAARQLVVGLSSSVGWASAAGARTASGSVLSHIDAAGAASMVDVSGKATTKREAVAGATVQLGPTAFEALSDNAKGDVLAVARVAGVLAAKRTADLIPLCHPLLISHASVPPAAGGLGARPFRLRAEPREQVDFELDAAAHSLHITASASCAAGTGVEMEAMTAASVAALTVYDMCKAASKGIVISDLRLLRKSGGKSGEWRARVEERGAAATAPE